MLGAGARQVGARRRAVGCGRRAVRRLAVAALCAPFSLSLPVLSLPVFWPTSARAIDTPVDPSSQAQRSFAELWNEVTDPYGGTLDDYRSTAAELAVLTAGLINLLWPEGPDRPMD